MPESLRLIEERARLAEDSCRLAYDNFRLIQHPSAQQLGRMICRAGLAAADNYRTQRAEVESPEKAALAYREFVRVAVRRAVRARLEGFSLR
jgi:hypothetical protein